jgi:nitrite reductase/ring-hydroxylating ferredoxin subunit
MEEKAEKGFMSINRFAKQCFLSGFLLLVTCSCTDEGLDVFIDDLPPTPFFSVQLNLSLISSQNLVLNDFLYRDDLGINGIVIIKRGENRYVAYERTCPYQPEEPCSRVSFINLGTDSILICDCEDANYKAENGFSTVRPTDIPKRLRQYPTQLSGNTLFVRSEY